MERQRMHGEGEERKRGEEEGDPRLLCLLLYVLIHLPVRCHLTIKFQTPLRQVVNLTEMLDSHQPSGPSGCLSSQHW